MLSLASVARALGGKVIGGVVRAPAPGCSKHSVALVVGLSHQAPDGWWAKDHSGRMTPREAADYVRERCGLPLFDPPRRPERSTHQAPPSRGVSHIRNPKCASDDAHVRTAAALRLWGERVDAGGTVVEKYIVQTRKLYLSPYVATEVLGWHARIGAMIALFRNVHTGEPQAISRTYLTPDGEKARSERLFLGPSGSAAVMLKPHEDVTHGLCIAEGIESAIACTMLGFSPAWATGSAGAIGIFPVLAAVETLTISRETDDKGANFQRSGECAARWHDAGREVRFATPLIKGDAADVVRGAAA